MVSVKNAVTGSPTQFSTATRFAVCGDLEQFDELTNPVVLGGFTIIGTVIKAFFII